MRRPLIRKTPPQERGSINAGQSKYLLLKKLSSPGIDDTTYLWWGFSYVKVGAGFTECVITSFENDS
jgi:hypothetical protein